MPRISISILTDGGHDGFLRFYPSKARNDQWRILLLTVQVLIPAGDVGEQIFSNAVSLSPRSKILAAIFLISPWPFSFMVFTRL